MIMTSWEEHQEHVKNYHYNVWRYRCGLCAEILEDKHDLKSHRKRVHAGGTFGKKICPGCGKYFA